MLDFGLAQDITPVSNPPHFQEYRDKGWTPLNDRGHSLMSTHVLDKRYRVGEFDMESTSTGLESRLGEEAYKPVMDQGELPDRSAVDEARDSRIALLVQKYEGDATTEDSARLDILTQRLRQLMPRTTPDDTEKLRLMVENMEEISADLCRLKNGLGLL